MKKILNFILSGYVRLLFPLIICLMLVEKILHIMNPLIHKIKDTLHVTKFIGFLDVFVVSLLVLAVLGLLAGLLLKSPFVTKIIKNIESGMLRKIPLYSELKSMFGKGLDNPEAEHYLPALLREEGRFALGYVTDQSEHFYTIVICDTSLHGGELRVAPKDSVKLLNISYFDFAQRIRMYGANVAHFAEEAEGAAKAE